jgi:transcription initiation factor TFIID subunit 9B
LFLLLGGKQTNTLFLSFSQSQYILSLATQTNAQPLPPVPEVFGLRLPPANECLTAVDFDLVPNRPPPEEKHFDEEIEELVESASEDEDDDMEPATIPPAAAPAVSQPQTAAPHPTVANVVNAAPTPSEDVEMADTAAAVPNEVEEGSDEDDGLFAGGEESGADEPMEEVNAAAEDQGDGSKRKLVEEDDYD